MTPRKLYTIDAGAFRTLLKTAARAHTNSIAAKRKEEQSVFESYDREAARIDKIREGYYARGIMFAIPMFMMSEPVNWFGLLLTSVGLGSPIGNTRRRPRM